MAGYDANTRHADAAARGFGPPALALACVGFACYSVVGIFDFSPSLCLQPSLEAQALIGSLKPWSRIADIAVLLAMAVCAQRWASMRSRRRLAVAMGCLYSCGLALVLVSGHASSCFVPGLVLGVFMKSFGVAFVVLWAEILAAFNVRSIVAVVAGSYLLCFCMVGYFALNESLSTSSVIALLPLASAALLACLSTEGGRAGCAEAREGAGKRRALSLKGLPVKQLSAIAVFGAAQLLVNSVSERRIGYSVEASTIVAGALASLALLALVFLSGKRFRMVLLSRVLIPTLIIAMLLVLMAEPGFQRYESYALGAGYAVYRVFAVCLWCYFGKSSPLGTATVVAVGQAMSVVCNGMEKPLEEFLFQGDVMQSVVVAAVIVVVLVAALFLLGESDLSTVPGKKELLRFASAEDYRNECVAVAGERFALTQRERDICLLLMRGRATDEICEELFVSQATLKTHMRNIYRKTGVHSRLELLALLRDAGA